MDTSEIYIKMCEKAEEIQGAKSKGFIVGSFPSFIYNGDDIYVQLKGLIVIWLPRQDQLQEMVYSPQPRGYGYDKLISLKLFEWATEYNTHYNCVGYKEYPNSFTSMEQLWLAFVMKEKWGKTWNGKTWTKN